MKLDRYELKAGTQLTSFEFLSEGPKGKITKLIRFEQMNLPGIYNLAFGDKHPSGNDIDDQVVTDNGDADKVLATVVAAIYAFSDRYPGSWIYATGSTASRTRLYRMGINRFFELVEADFDIMGEQANEWEWYEKGKDYQAFAARRKSVNLSDEDDA